MKKTKKITSINTSSKSSFKFFYREREKRDIQIGLFFKKSIHTKSISCCTTGFDIGGTATDWAVGGRAIDCAADGAATERCI